MELVGDFRSTNPIFKGCYGDSFLYTNVDLGWLRWLGIHFPPYQSEIPAPSYLQARQPKAMKWSTPRAVTLNPAVESPKAKRSGSKGRHHRSSGHSSNTSTSKHPDSTSARKPSSAKEPAMNKQEKSLRSHGSHKHSRSPSPSAESVGCKQKGVRTEDTHALNSTLPISSSAFDGFCSPMESHSDVTDLQPPSITSTPLGLGALRHWQTMSDESRYSLAPIYTSPGFNLPGYPAADPGNLTPSFPSLAGSHHVSSTWPTGMFISGPSSPHLTIDQAKSLFKLAAECQALGIKLAKQFQVLLGLEAMHHNSIQGKAYETLMLRCSAREAAYSAILQDRVSEDKCEATTHCLCSEVNAAWKEMHEVMYNHQLQYDQQLATFLTEAEMALSNMRGEVWASVDASAENEGITFDACLGIALQVLNLLLQLSIDISFQTQIPLTITYCPESSIYRRWHPEQGGFSPLCKEIRASHTPSKVLGRNNHQPREGGGRPTSPATSDHSAGSGGSLDSRHQSRSHAQSITPACSRRSGSVGLAASRHSIHSHATEDDEVSSSESESSHDDGDGTTEDGNAKEDKGRIETSSDGQVASDDEEGQEHPHTQDTLTGISQVFGGHKDTDPELEPREKIQSIQQKWHAKSPKEDSPLKESSESSSPEEEAPTDKALRNGARQKAQLLDTRFEA